MMIWKECETKRS